MLPALDIAQWLRDDGLLTRWHRSRVPSLRQQESPRHGLKVPSLRQQESPRHGLKVPSLRQQESKFMAHVKGWRDLNLHEAYERHGQEIAFTAQPITSRAAASGRKPVVIRACLELSLLQWLKYTCGDLRSLERCSLP